MKNSGKNLVNVSKIALAGLSLLFVTLIFQNCDMTQPESDPDSLDDIRNRIVFPPLTVDEFDYSTEVLLAPADNYRKVKVHSNEVYIDDDLGITTRPFMEVDLDSFSVFFEVVNDASYTCILSPDRAAELEAILTGASICGPPALAPGNVQCMAIPVSDIFMYNSIGVESSLAAHLCGQGQWLCGGDDDRLRSILRSMIEDDQMDGCSIP